MPSQFEQALELLAERMAESGELESGHVRWAIYCRAMDCPEEWPNLLTVVQLEPDPAISSSVVIQMLDRVPLEQREDYVKALPPGKSRELAATRAREIRILNLLSEGRSDHLPAGDLRVDSWTNWLQLRAASSVNDFHVLDSLSRVGRTRRVRSTATTRLRSTR